MSVALVTGGTRGIGLGIAHALRNAGFELVVNGQRAPSDVADVTTQLGAHYIQADIAESSGRSTILKQVRDRFGRLDVLVNNAGVAPLERNDITATTEESYDRVMAINLRGPFFLSQLVAKWMLEQQDADPDTRRSIITISSVSATLASPDRAEYCISKAGLAMFSRTLAARLAPEGIDVYEVRPGVIRTDMTAQVEAKYDALFEQGLAPEARWGSPEDVGRAVVMLARGDLTYAAGQVITVDGGMSLPRL